MLMCDDLLTQKVTVLRFYAIIILLVVLMVVLSGSRIKRFDQVHLLLLLSRVIIHL